MTLNDPLSNAMSLISNAEKKGKKSCVIFPANGIIKGVLHLLQDRRFIGEFKEHEDTKGKSLEVQLIGSINKCGVVKPRFAVQKEDFERFEKRFLIAKDFGILVVSTTHGLMTHLEAKEKGVGGRLLAYCY
ncbi:30S ribosomal protein S8 [Candidatus Woesearchaeota archaeon]|nr:30S ribosomal protein S8 [Candidatus Woesearchaeota archaeon]